MSNLSFHVKPLSFRRRKRRPYLRIALILLALIALVIPSVSGYVAWSLTHPDKKPLAATPDSVGLTYQDIEFSSADGTLLRGWFLPATGSAATNDRLIVLAHGYRGNRLSDKPSLPTAKALVENGYAVLMFDFRNSGLSDGTLTTVGLLEKDDLLAAVRYAEGQGYGSQGIGLLGFSMGAATSLLAAADAPQVKALAVDSPFSDLKSYLQENLPHWSHLPEFPFTPVILRAIPLLIGHDTGEVSPIQAVDRLKDRPILFIHGGNDQAIAKHHSDRVVEALARPKEEIWSVPAAGHVGTYELEPMMYVEKVVSFFKVHLGSPQQEGTPSL